jgi:hypothetical protein
MVEGETLLRAFRSVVFAFVFGMTCAAAYGQPAAQGASGREAQPLKVVIYPILVYAPIFGVSIDMPALPPSESNGDPIAGSDVSESTGVALNAAYMAGFSVETDRIFAEVAGTWAALSATRNAPRMEVTSDTLFVGGRGGVRVFKGLWATAGVRRISVDLGATLTIPNLGSTVHGHTKPVLWDPLLGAEWRTHTRRFEFAANFQGGGFGVGTDTDLQSEFRAEMSVWRHLSLRAGYQFIYYKLSVADVLIGPFTREWVSSQTMHGPSVGIGLVF